MPEQKVQNDSNLPHLGENPAIRVTMLPRDTNANGTIFGGIILSYIDLAAAVEVGKTTLQRAVTKAIKEVIFKAPVRVGEVASFYTSTRRIGTTSITVHVNVTVWRNGAEIPVTEAELTYVTIDDNCRPVPVKRT